MGRKNDRALRIYTEVFELDRLHYGKWLPEEELSIENLKNAQERYENYLVENVPDGVNCILDVGCGNGIMTQSLINAGYEVEGLSPDINQKRKFTENIDAEFHHCAFREFIPKKKYDCLIMSESAQYIKLNRLFSGAKKAMASNGYLMICDYFVLNNAEGVFKKSGHNYEDFLNQAKSEGFTLIEEKDITDDVTKTLDIGKTAFDKLMLIVEIITEKFQKKHPYFIKFLKWFFRKRINKYDKQIQLLDSQKFKEYKTYRFMVFQINENYQS